jgi:hypothetical protein
MSARFVVLLYLSRFAIASKTRSNIAPEAVFGHPDMNFF